VTQPASACYAVLKKRPGDAWLEASKRQTTVRASRDIDIPMRSVLCSNASFRASYSLRRSLRRAQSRVRR